MIGSPYDVGLNLNFDVTTRMRSSPFPPNPANNSTLPLEISSSDLFKKKLIRFLTEETSLIWILFGTIGNLLTLLVLCKQRMRKHSTFTYLTILSLCDTLVLYFGLFRDYLVYKYKYDIDGDFICKFHVFFFYFVLHMASWLLVAVNIDRLIAASFLSFSKKWCTPRVAIIVSLSLAVFFFLINSHFIFFVNSMSGSKPSNSNHTKQTELSILDKNFAQLLINNKEISNDLISNMKSNEKAFEKVFEEEQESVNPFVYSKCLIKTNWPKYNYFFSNIFTWIDAGAQVILPFVIMLICNVNIIFKVLINKSKSNGKNEKRLRKIKGMCIMIVSVSVIFFVLEMPVLIFLCLMQGKFESNLTIDLLWTVVNLMMYTNHVINFFSYCMTGTQFRSELINLFLIDFKCLKLFPSLVTRCPCLFFSPDQKLDKPTATHFSRRGMFIKKREDTLFFHHTNNQNERTFMLIDTLRKPNTNLILSDTTNRKGDASKKILLTKCILEKRRKLENIRDKEKEQLSDDTPDENECINQKVSALVYANSLNETKKKRHFEKRNSLVLHNKTCRRLFNL